MEDASIEDKEVSWRILDTPVNGTVTAPKDEGLHPAVVFLAGSGPTDRDWCSPLLPGTNGTAKILAEALARRGYATLRYDKLGSGPHVKENLPRFAGKVGMHAFMEELAGGVDTIASQRNVDGSSVFALTNSEGAIHAVNYQIQTTTNRFKGFVLTGAPGRAIGDVARTQFFNQSKAIPNGETLMERYDEAIGDFLAGRPMVIAPSLPKSMEPFFRALESPNNLPFSRELWTYNLAESIGKIIEPMLVVIGKKDIQVDWRLDGKPLENAVAKNAKASFVYPENANHVLKYEQMPREKLTPESAMTHYNSQESRLDDEAACAIFNWLDERSGQPGNLRDKSL
jgi:hypothetical protein